MHSQLPGISGWVAGIRYRMENDPGRQDLDNHIHCNGFLFLDEYLEDILTGKKESIIELTKTPGRRKDASKKMRFAIDAEVKMARLDFKVSPSVKGITPVSKPADDEDGTHALQTPYDRSFIDSEFTSTANSFPVDREEVTPVPKPADDEDGSFNDSVFTNTPGSFPVDAYGRDYETHELQYMVETDQSPQSAPQQSLQAQPLIRKASVPILPNLPGPSPLRKSTFESNGTGLGINNALPNGTRTSWLHKARDVTAKRTSVIAGVKRKSTDVSGADSMNLDDDYIRATKIAKTHTEKGDTSAEKAQTKVLIQPFRPVVLERPREQTPQDVAEGNSEGMMNILKRTVENLVGKSMGKSLGGAAASAAAAEAKAAAEARLAQRDAKISDENRQGRLSISDLISVDHSEARESKGPKPIPNVGPDISSALEAASETRTSQSTTPPNSPPIVNGSTSDAATIAGGITQAIPVIPVQRHVSRDPSFTFLDSQPSTQSTNISSIFDTHSAWPPSSQATEPAASQGLSQPGVQSKDPSLNREYMRPESEKVALEDIGSHEIVPQTEEETIGRDASSPFSEIGATNSKDDSSHPSSQTGLIAQASGLFSKVMGTSVASALGASKRGKAEPPKSIQLAAAAAKKQQEEADKKAARLKEMEKRRAAVASRKAEQEAAEKAKQQSERRKRDNEEERKVTRATVKKTEEDVTKKRKVFVEIEKPKPLLKDTNGSRILRPLNNSQMQLGQSTLSKSFKQPGVPASVAQSTVKLINPNQGELQASHGVSKPASTRAHNVPGDLLQPSQTLHAQMQARVEAQMLQSRHDEPIIPSESIELPDINSEYSNSDDEDRPRTFDPPDWAQSPDLRIALESQSRVNPDDIFGPVRPLRMEEIFPTRQSRFRARTSSANWTGTDEVTRDEEAQYAKRMGYLD